MVDNLDRRITVIYLVLGAGFLLSSPRSAAAMTEPELCGLYLDIVEDAVDCFEPLWVDDSARVPDSGFFDFRKYDTWGPKWYAPEITVPGNGMIAYCYSVLLEETDKEVFGERRVPRAVLLDHAIKSIRWWCLTSAYVDKPYPFNIPGGYPRRMKGENWIRPLGHRTDVMGWPAMAAARLWDELDDETKKLVEQVMIGVAPKERLVRSWQPGGQGGNHDVVKQDMASTIGAAFLFPGREDAKTYLDVIRGNGIDLVSTLHDRACDVVADGKPIREWSKGWNLYQDYSSDHHGWAQVWYGGDMMFEGRSYVELLSRLKGVPVPETFTYAGNGFDGVLEWHKTLCLPEGEPASVHGMEYDAYYGAGLLIYCYGAVIKKDPVAAALEERAAHLLERHTRAVKVYDYHRNSWAKAATAYLMHKHAGPRAEPDPFDKGWQLLKGTYHYRWQQNLIHRSNDKWASWSWGSLSGGSRRAALCGFVVPARGLAAQLDPLVYLHPRSLIGEVQVERNGKPVEGPPAETVYRHTATDAGFQTAGVASDAMLDRYYAFCSFNDGPCVMFSTFRAKQDSTLNWLGLPVYFYARPGMTTSRQYHDAEGAQSLEQAAERQSNWWCVDGMLGLATAGGNGRVKIERSVGNNWARTDAYKDKCDGVFVSPIAEQDLHAGDTPVDLACAIDPHASPDQSARTASAIGQGQHELSLPAGWKGLFIPDHAHPGKKYLFIANLHGVYTYANLVPESSFDEGAPILSSCTTIGRSEGKPVSLSSVLLAEWECFAETIELYGEVRNEAWVHATKEAYNRYCLDPDNDSRVELRLRYTGAGGTTLVVRSDSGKEQRLPIGDSDEGRTFDIEITGLTYVEIEGPGYADRTGPAVEIAAVEVREDGRVTIEATAGDQSGIARVALYCDGKLLTKSPSQSPEITLGGRRRHTSFGRGYELSSGPYVWLHRPGDGFHTYHAVAVDASPKRNERASFKRTIEVGARSSW